MRTMEELKQVSLAWMDLTQIESRISDVIVTGRASVEFTKTDNLNHQTDDPKFLHPAGADRLKANGYTVDYDILRDIYTVSGWFAD